MVKLVTPKKNTYTIPGKNGVKGVFAPPEKLEEMEKEGVISPVRKFKKIEAMPDDDRSLLMGMFYQGKSIPDIAANLHDMGHFKDVKPSTLEKYLYRFKWEVVDKQALARTEAMKDSTKAKLLKELATEYDVLEELSSLIGVQKARLEKLLAREKDMPMLFNSANGEIKSLAALLQQYAQMQFDLGYLKKIGSLTKITDDTGRTVTVESEGQASVVVGTEQRSRIEDAARSFFDILNRTTGHRSPITLDQPATRVGDEND